MTTNRGRRRLVVYTDAEMMAGAEQSLATLIAYLPSDVAVSVVGHRPEIVRSVAAARPSAQAVIVRPLATKADYRGLLALRSTLLELAPSAIHLNKTEVGGLRYVECVARTIPNCRVVSVVHHVEQPGSLIARLLSKRLAAGADAIVAVSRSLARNLEGILELPSGRVQAIGNAVPAGPVPSAPPDRPFTVGTLARFVPHKAVEDVIAAVASVDAAHLLIGGDGPERAKLERLVWRLGLANRTEFLGWVEPEQVLDNCHVFASAARIEGHPLALLEARRRGLPIVAADVGGVPEIVDHEVNGFLVPATHVTGFGNAIRRLADNPVLLRSMSRAALAAAEADGGPTEMAAAYQDLYWPSSGPPSGRARETREAC